MPNSIALITKYLPILDEIYKNASLTSILDATANKVQFLGANAVKLFKTSVDGLGNYSRNSGYVDGSVTATWETLTLTQDRGRSFMVDSMDNEETANLAFGTLAGEFIRTKVVPEIDSYRFASYAAAAGTVKAEALATSAAVLAAIDVAEEKMNDDEVPTEGRILFIANSQYTLLKNAITRTYTNEGGIERAIEMFDNMRVIRVPKTRFNTAITLNDGTTSGQEAGGYVVGGYPINFMIVHPSAVVQTVKHENPRVFSPDVNQKADAWKYDYRVYHGAFVEANKTAGIYVSRDTTAN
jgi:hypothetical protein